MNEIDFMNLGAIDQQQKPSDFELGAVASSEPIPESYRTPYNGIIYHQRKIPACGSHAGAYIKNVHEGRNHSPAYLWKRIKQTDGYAPEQGTSMEAIFKTLKDVGVCSLDLMPNDTLQSLEDYTDPSVITKAMDEDAAKSKIGAYGYDWQPTFESTKRAIYDHKVVMARIEISADWWTPSWAGKDILPLKKKFPGQGGHFVVFTEYDKDSIGGLNEWGITWGNGGKLYFKEDYIGRVTHLGTCFDLVEKADNAYTRLVKFGMKGTDVGLIQKALKDKGYFTHSITGYFGNITLRAVVAFQKANGLVPDGKVGIKTWTALFKVV